jgi:hypothetical protein
MHARLAVHIKNSTNVTVFLAMTYEKSLHMTITKQKFMSKAIKLKSVREHFDILLITLWMDSTILVRTFKEK